ncbi:MAG: N-acetylmuramoyl-L-alanine amidase [Chloroflexi bacterium]|nr:N-acetylmuramoyl-L-alanine amidase [Chloroflexota bacterium]
MTYQHLPPPTPSKRAPKPTGYKVSRRDFLALTGLGLAGALACAGVSAIGYSVINEESHTPTPVPPTRTPDPARLARFKQVDRPPIITREEWGARSVNHEAEDEFGFYSLDNPEGWREYEGDLRLAYQTVVIHHSSLYDTDDDTTMREIQNLHMDERGWADVAYHFGVGLTGKVYEGRKMSARGTHTELHNTGSLGVCLFGNFEEISPTQIQLDNTQALVNWLAIRLNLTHLAGHREFNDTTVCPGANLYSVLDKMAERAFLQRGTGGYIAPPEQLITPSPDAQTLSYQSGGCECCSPRSII